jgi:hypothetical protein
LEPFQHFSAAYNHISTFKNLFDQQFIQTITIPAKRAVQSKTINTAQVLTIRELDCEFSQ